MPELTFKNSMSYPGTCVTITELNRNIFEIRFSTVSKEFHFLYNVNQPMDEFFNVIRSEHNEFEISNDDLNFLRKNLEEQVQSVIEKKIKAISDLLKLNEDEHSTVKVCLEFNHSSNNEDRWECKVIHNDINLFVEKTYDTPEKALDTAYEKIKENR